MNNKKYCNSSDEKIKGHLTQLRQNVRSTKPQPLQSQPSSRSSGETHFRVEPVQKIYTDDMGRFPIFTRSGNQYIMITYHCDTNIIILEPFATQCDRDRIKAYTNIMKRLKKNDPTTSSQAMDNEVSAGFKKVIEKEWNINLKLVPPDVHQRNTAERSICKFKAHFLAILAGVHSQFPNYLWDHLLLQT